MSKKNLKITGSWFTLDVRYSKTALMTIVAVFIISVICCIAAPSTLWRVLFLLLLILFLAVCGWYFFHDVKVEHVDATEKKKETPKKTQSPKAPKTEQKEEIKHSNRKEPPMNKVPIPQAAPEGFAPPPTSEQAMDEWRNFYDIDE